MKRLAREVLAGMKEDVIEHTEIFRQYAAEIVFVLVYYAITLLVMYFSVMYIYRLNGWTEFVDGVYIVVFAAAYVMIFIVATPSWVLSHIPKAKKKIERDDEDVIGKLGSNY